MMKDVVSDKKIIRKDRMRFAKNKLSSWLTYLAIVADVFYFVSIYKSNVTNYYTFYVGLSVVYNLMFMLFCFLSAEGIKNYRRQFGIVLIVIGALQILRIFFYPMQMHSTEYQSGDNVLLVMVDAQFVRVVIYLCVSAALLIAAGVTGIVRSNTLQRFNEELETDEGRQRLADALTNYGEESAADASDETVGTSGAELKQNVFLRKVPSLLAWIVIGLLAAVCLLFSLLVMF